ncbi:MAG: OB-fold domain-containing protein [Promethearchaeota archaeon]
MVVGIARYGAYLPKYVLPRGKIAEAWDFPSIPGGIAVSNADEDSLTMAVEAGLDCLGDSDPKLVDALFFASTTPPYTEKASSSIVAAALDLRDDVDAMDVADSTRASTIAFRRAREAIASGAAKRVLVVAADSRVPMPESMYEYTHGDGAAAVLLSDEDVAVTVVGAKSITDVTSGPWKRATDKWVRQFEIKHENVYGFAGNVARAVGALVKEHGVDPKKVKKVALAAPDPRSAMAVAKRLGFKERAVQDSLFMSVGHLGNAHALMLLILALRRGRPGDQVVFAGYGDGADAFLLEVADKERLLAARSACRGVSGYLNAQVQLEKYASYLAKKEKLETDRFTRKSSPVRVWRDRKILAPLYGMRCTACGVVQYPIWRACIECGAKDQRELVKLAKTGVVFTYTLDHLVGGSYFVTPVPRCVVDLDGGGRILLDMTDCDPHDVKIGMRVELTYRKVHEGANFVNYYWKCRPPREPEGSGPEAEGPGGSD